MPATTEGKKKTVRAQLSPTHKTSPPFIEVALARSPNDSQECS